MSKYIRIQESEVPAGVRFDVPGHNQGQIVEVAYGGFGRAEHGPGDTYKRITDRSDRSVEFYKRSRFRFTRAALENIAETSADPELDLRDLLSGARTLESLLAFCLDGADDDRREGWEDYVSELSSHANVGGAS